MLKPNTSDSYPGADFVAADPVSSADCCQQQSVALLIVQLRILNAPFIMRGGKLYFEQAAAAQLDMCLGAAPTISALDSNDWDDAETRLITAANKGAVEGEVWVGDSATWAGSVLKVEQTVVTWAGADIEITTVKGGFGWSPPPGYVYVVNACGRPNAVGYEMAWVSP